MKVCWNLTNLCNEDCIYCFRELAETARPLEDNIDVINKLKGIGVTRITYAGGEPLLYKGLIDLMAYSKFLGIENCLITNGKLLTKDNLKDYLQYVDKLTFSIDSPSEYVNESSGRGKEHYQHIKEILPYIKEQFPHIRLEINSVTTNMNLKEVDFMFEAIGSELSFYGIKKWKISRFCPLRGYAKERKNLLNVPDQVFDAIKSKYDGVKGLFEVSVRDLDAIEENLVVSPRGSLKQSINGEEVVLVDDIIRTSTDTMIKKLGGRHV